MTEQLAMDLGSPRALPTAAETVAEGREKAKAAYDAAHEEWKQQAASVVESLMARQDTVCGNDVWATGLRFPRDKRALGHLFTERARAGRLVAAGKVASRYGHGSEITLWRVVRDG